MKLIEFKQQNNVIAENQPEYLNMPAYVDTDKGVVTTKWKLGFLERFKVLFTGVVWQQMRTFNKPVQPQNLFTNNPWKEGGDE